MVFRWSRNLNRYLSKVWTGTVKISYDSATLVNSHSDLWPAIYSRCSSSLTSATVGSTCCSMWSLFSGPPSPTTPCPSPPFAHGSPRRRWDSHSTHGCGSGSYIYIFIVPVDLQEFSGFFIQDSVTTRNNIRASSVVALYSMSAISELTCKSGNTFI